MTLGLCPPTRQTTLRFELYCNRKRRFWATFQRRTGSCRCPRHGLPGWDANQRSPPTAEDEPAAQASLDLAKPIGAAGVRVMGQTEATDDASPACRPLEMSPPSHRRSGRQA